METTIIGSLEQPRVRVEHAGAHAVAAASNAHLAACAAGAGCSTQGAGNNTQQVQAVTGHLKQQQAAHASKPAKTDRRCQPDRVQKYYVT